MKLGPRYMLLCDDSGGPDEALRVLAAVSGPGRSLVALERDLREVLGRTGVKELKWAGLRTRATKLHAAEEFLQLACAAMASGALRVDVLLWSAESASKSSQELGEGLRAERLYAKLMATTAKGWAVGRWFAYPDQRTGIAWKKLEKEVSGLFKGSGRTWAGLRQARSHENALIQLADLLAGLARHAALQSKGARLAGRGAGDGAAAARNRDVLLERLLAVAQAFGLRLKRGAQGLAAAGRGITVRRLVRLAG